MLASKLAGLSKLNTVMSTSSKLTYPAVGNAVSVGISVVTGSMLGDEILKL